MKGGVGSKGLCAWGLVVIENKNYLNQKPEIESRSF